MFAAGAKSRELRLKSAIVLGKQRSPALIPVSAQCEAPKSASSRFLHALLQALLHAREASN
jgi:hypothetical protein